MAGGIPASPVGWVSGGGHCATRIRPRAVGLCPRNRSARLEQHCVTSCSSPDRPFRIYDPKQSRVPQCWRSIVDEIWKTSGTGQTDTETMISASKGDLCGVRQLMRRDRRPTMVRDLRVSGRIRDLTSERGGTVDLLGSSTTGECVTPRARVGRTGTRTQVIAPIGTPQKRTGHNGPGAGDLQEHGGPHQAGQKRSTE